MSTKPYYKTKVDVVYDYIITGMRNREFVNCSKLNISNIANELGVSETPVREALRKLQTEGLVTLASNKGFYISLPESDELEGYFDILSLLEYYAASVSLDHFSEATLDELTRLNERMRDEGLKENFPDQRAYNHQFHQLIVNNAHNSYLSKLFMKEQNKYSVSQKEFYDVQKNTERVFSEHNEIIHAIRTKDRDRLRELLRKHKFAAFMNIVDGFGMDGRFDQ